MNNDFELEMADVSKLFEELNGMQLEEDTYVVVDGTMIPDAVDVFATLKNPKVKIIYYSSCGKYLQEGMDMTMAGLVVVDRSMEHEFQNLRKATGTILYEPSASLFPMPEAEAYRKRSVRMTRNASMLAQGLEECPFVDVRFPKLPVHSDFAIASKFPSIGGVLTFCFREASLNTLDSLERFVDTLHRFREGQTCPCT